LKGDDVLIEHHGVLRSLLTRIASMPGSDGERRRLLDELITELNIHTKIEEQLFYPAVRTVSRLVDISFAEHRQLDDQVAVVLRTPIESERFDEEFGALRGGVEEHAGEEERIMFPESHALGEAELEALGGRLQHCMEQLRTSKVARALIVLKRETLRRV